MSESKISDNGVESLTCKFAHDLNNLLTPLLTYAPMLRKHLPKRGIALELLDGIEKSGRDMAHITEQMLILGSFRAAEAGERICVNRDVLVEFNRNARERCIEKEVSFGLGDSVDGMVVAESRYLYVALDSIFTNALEAVDGRIGGEISMFVEMRDEPVERMSACGATVDAGKYVAICIGDNGKGLASGIQDTLFDAFVTTRKSANRRGAGLGLAVAKKIVHVYGGYLDWCELDPGTKFVLCLPLSGS